MDARKFLGLEATHNPHRWYLPVVPGLCTGNMFLFGGCGLAAAIEALEATTGRPLVWATAQYLSYARPPSVMDIDVIVPVTGKSVTQARAIAHVGDTEILTVQAALGSREIPAEGAWPTPPEVPRPEECEARSFRREVDDSIMRRIDVRLASARNPMDLSGERSVDGHSSLWARIPDLLDPSAAALAVLGDYVPFGIGQALGEAAGGNSLDNTLRIGHLVPTEWVLIDIRVEAIANGFGHGHVYLWSEDGTLMATASQSTIVRWWDPAQLEAEIKRR